MYLDCVAAPISILSGARGHASGRNRPRALPVTPCAPLATGFLNNPGYVMENASYVLGTAPSVPSSFGAKNRLYSANPNIVAIPMTKKTIHRLRGEGSAWPSTKWV